MAVEPNTGQVFEPEAAPRDTCHASNRPRLRRNVCALAAMALCHICWEPCDALAQAEPTVSGPEATGPTRETRLPGPATRPVKYVIELDFEGDCLTKDKIVREVLKTWEWRVSDRVNRRISVSVAGEEKPTLGARFWLRVDGKPASYREIEYSGSCATLSEAVGTAIALAIDALDLNDYPLPAPEPAETPSPATVAGPPKPADKRPRDAPVLRPRRKPQRGTVRSIVLGAHMLGTVGVAPRSAVVIGLRGELGFPHGLSSRLGTAYLMSDAVPIADGSISTITLSGQAGGCWGAQLREFQARACVDGWLGAMRADPENLERSSNETLPWFAVVPGIEFAFHEQNDLGIRFGAQLSINLVRPRFEVLSNTTEEPLDERTAPPLGFMGSLGLDWIAY